MSPHANRDAGREVYRVLTPIRIREPRGTGASSELVWSTPDQARSCYAMEVTNPERDEWIGAMERALVPLLESATGHRFHPPPLGNGQYRALGALRTTTPMRERHLIST